MACSTVSRYVLISVLSFLILLNLYIKKRKTVSLCHRNSDKMAYKANAEIQPGLELGLADTLHGLSRPEDE